MATLPRLPDAVINAAGNATLQATAAAAGGVLPLIYGRQRVGGLIFALGTLDGDLVVGAAWCIGPVSQIESIAINDEAVPSTVTVTSYTGSVSQAVDTTLATAIAGYADKMVASIANVEVPVCYSVFRIPPGAISGFPRVNAIIRGKLVYDPRTATSAYSRNPALCLADWLISPAYGQGQQSIDWDSVDAAADACDEALSDASARREIDLALDHSLPVAQWSDVLRVYAGCFICHDGTNVKLVPDRPVTLAGLPAVDAGDMVQDSFVLRRLSSRQRPTVVTVQYTDTSATPWRTSSVQAVDGAAVSGEAAWREETVSLPGITRDAQAYREAFERLNAAKYADLIAEWSAFDEAAAHHIGDVVLLTHAVGLTAEPFRITDAQIETPGRYRISAAVYSTDVYADTVTPPWSGDYTALPSPGDIPVLTNLVCASGSTHLLAATDGTVLSRIYVSWDAPDFPYVQYVEAEFKRATDSSYQRTTGDTYAYCVPVEDAVTYDVRCRIRNVFGNTGEWATTQHVVIGKTEAPPPAQNFAVTAYADGTRAFTWEPPATPPVDLDGYQIRYKLGTGQVWADMYALHTGLLYASPYEANILAAGTYTFAIAAVDTTGNVSTPAYIETTLPDPRLGGALDFFDVYQLGWPGTKTNCAVDALTGWLVATDTKTWADFATDGIDWSEWLGFARDAADMTYEHSVIDIGIKIRFTPVVSVIAPEGTPTVQVATSDDNSTWSSWATVTGPVECRYLKARCQITGSAGAQLRLEGMTILLDAKPIEETIEDLDTSTLTGSYDLGTGDIRLPITESYAVIRSVSVTLQNVGAGWSWELIDKDTTTGPRIKIYNSSNAAADATIDALIRGL